MSALSAVLRDAEILVVADRAAIQVGEYLSRGVPAIAADQRKLFVTPNHLAVGVLGHSIVNRGDQEPVDLLSTAVAQASGGIDAGHAAAAVLTAFSDLAPLVREHIHGEGASIPPFSIEVLTAVLIAGFINGNPSMFAVGLTYSGSCALEQVAPPGIGWGPPPCVADLALSVENGRAAITMEGALEHGIAGVRSCSTRHPALVSQDVDYVVLSPSREPVAGTSKYVSELPPFA